MNDKDRLAAEKHRGQLARGIDLLNTPGRPRTDVDEVGGGGGDVEGLNCGSCGMLDSPSGGEVAAGIRSTCGRLGLGLHPDGVVLEFIS
jgi:hypothetical protein